MKNEASYDEAIVIKSKENRAWNVWSWILISTGTVLDETDLFTNVLVSKKNTQKSPDDHSEWSATDAIMRPICELTRLTIKLKSTSEIICFSSFGLELGGRVPPFKI